MKEQKKIIPDAMIPYEGSTIKGIDGEDYILKNSAMYTAYQHSQAEHSRFFLGLKNQCVILGRRCPSCNILDVPPAKLRCPQCSPPPVPGEKLQQIGFMEMVLEEVSDRGFMEASPPVVCFAPANFKTEVPYANGYVCLWSKTGIDYSTAIKLRIRTTTGLIRPGIVKWKDEVKIVFRNEREGSIRDIFAVPARELTQEQWNKSPLFENDLMWATDDLQRKCKDHMRAHRDVIVRIPFQIFAERISQSKRAQKDLSNWKSVIRVYTEGGVFGLKIENNLLTVIDGDVQDPDVVFSVDNPYVFLDYLEKGCALTNLFLEGKLNLSVLNETVFKLDRIPRSLKRDDC